MTTNDPTSPDPRRCPRCGAMGILPLDQPHSEHGEIVGPVMLCPICEEEFRADGTTWLGAVELADMADQEIEEAARAIDDWFMAQVERSSG